MDFNTAILSNSRKNMLTTEFCSGSGISQRHSLMHIPFVLFGALFLLDLMRTIKTKVIAGSDYP